MAQVNFARREITAKLVYYGPGMSGKTTNLEKVFEKVPDKHKGNFTSIATDGDRTLYFDFLPLDLGEVAGMKTKLQLYTVPGQVYYASTRKLVLSGTDGVAFIADSHPSKRQENDDSLTNLIEDLASYGKRIETTPAVLQYNKRDLPEVMPISEMEADLNRWQLQAFQAVAVRGEGVFPTLKAMIALVLRDLQMRFGGSVR